MKRLCDEVIELIFYELDDPTALTLTSKHFHSLSQDPYVRAHYFLNRYGRMDAMFWALGRGRVMTDKVIDVLINSGAYISRYLVQVAIHHYFRSASHFIKTPWVRTMSIPVFAHFMRVTCGLFDDVPLGKNEDDGFLFSMFLKESRLPPQSKSTKWETVRDIFGKYKFIPFSMKDPLMVQLPIALAVEPRLLPYAEANGFHMDTKYRDFVFRKMFEKPSLNNNDRSDDILRNVRELRRLDSRMFLSRTVAAEICMESKSNESAYRALKTLDRAKELLFDLSTVVTELIKLFVRTRSITSNYTINVLTQLYADFPSTDPTVRLVMLLTACLSDNVLVPSGTLKSKLESLGLLPLKRKDIVDILTNPFIEKHSTLTSFAKDEMNLSMNEVEEILQEVALKSLRVGSKGKTLKKLVEHYPYFQAVLQENAVQRYTINLDNLPPSDDEDACAAYEAPLCRDFNNNSKSSRNTSGRAGVMSLNLAASGASGVLESDAMTIEVHETDEDEIGHELAEGETGDASELGIIGQDTLSFMIRQDEMAPTRSRRRSIYFNYYGSDTTGKLGYPQDSIQVGRWVKERYHARSAMAATFLTHAVINNNMTLLHFFFSCNAPSTYVSTSQHVPVTFKHFRLLARLGKAPNWSLYHEIENGAEFYFSEDDYLSKQPPIPEPKRHSKVKIKSDVRKESSSPGIPRASTQAGPSKVQASPRSSKRRPRRSAAAVTSYVIPDSDDEAIVEDDDDNAVVVLMTMQANKRKVESNLQRWIKHLSILLAEEQKKYKEKRKRLEKCTLADGRRRVAKSEFHKSLMVNLRSLRKTDLDKRKQLYGPDAAEDDYFTEDDGDEEYRHRTTRTNKRRRVIT